MEDLHKQHSHHSDKLISVHDDLKKEKKEIENKYSFLIEDNNKFKLEKE